jgi:hypothetical protein
MEENENNESVMKISKSLKTEWMICKFINLLFYTLIY